MRRLAWLGLLALGLSSYGCGDDKDKTAPPPPRVDPIESPTSQSQVTITGSAEFGAKIEVTGAVAVEPSDPIADPFDASFRVVVTLEENATSELSFVARDGAGNASTPTVLTIEHEGGHGAPADLSLELFVNDSETPVADPVTIAAGDTLRAVAKVEDAAGHELDLPIAISTSIPDAFVAGTEISSIRVAGEFSVAATVAGSSFALSRAVSVTPGAAAEIVLDVSPANVMAGSAVYVTATARDAFGNALPDTDIALSSDPPLDASFTPACSTEELTQGFLDAHRFVAHDLSGVADSGYVFSLEASSGDVSASASVTIRPGPAARFAPLDPSDCTQGDLFAFTDATWQSDVAEPVNVSAGATVYYRYAVVDAYGNATDGPVSVVTSAPGANVIDDGVSGRGQVAHLISAGMFELTAYVAGVAAPAVKSFSVDVGAAQSASIFLSSTLVSPADEVIAFATVRDAFGNVVACPTGAIDDALIELVTVPVTGVVGGTVSCADGLFQRSFTFTDNGTYSVAVDYKEGNTAMASAYVTVLGIDATPPTVAIENLLVDGNPCVPAGDPPVCVVGRGNTIEFDVVADDNIALSELQYSAFFQTTGTLRTRALLLSGDTALPASVHFSFTVNNNALPEDVPLVALAMDGSGNRATSDALLLRVGVYTTFGRDVSVVAVGGSINQPRDIGFNAAGDMFIGNDGDQNLLQIANGATAPVVFSSFNRASRYLTVDGGGNIYVTDATRISRISAAGVTIDNYLSIGGNTTEGLDIVGATRAKGTIDATASNDGATVTIGGQVFELDVTGNGCGGANVCAVVGGGSKNAALATAIAASTMVDASHDTTGNRVVLAAKTAGEAGNSITLSTSGMAVSGATLSQGHGEELVLGQTNDNNVYRFPETLTPTANAASNHGAFNVGTTQRGVAVKDMSRASTAALRELFFYFVDDNNQDTVSAYRAVDSSAPVEIFSLTGGGGQSFDTLCDVALEPTLPAPNQNPVNGCLLVSDEQTGEIYALDTRDATDTTPAVTLIASGFNDPRGLAFYNGDLYVADRGDDAVIRLSPSASTTDCF